MLQQTRYALIFTVFGLASGCVTDQQVSNPLEDPAYKTALEQQKQAVRSVTVYKAVPGDAIGVRPIMAAACGGDSTMKEANEDYILQGLKLKAYKLAADGIAEVNIHELPDPSRHCQGNVPVGGTAKAFTVRH